jgi:serine/threonine protein kinase
MKGLDIMNKEYTHCDIKSDNIMVKFRKKTEGPKPEDIVRQEQNGITPIDIEYKNKPYYMLPKYIDFGLVTRFGSQCEGGTPGSIPLEFFDGNLLQSKFDIYSLGIVLLEMEFAHFRINNPLNLLSHLFVILNHEQKNGIEFTNILSPQLSPTSDSIKADPFYLLMKKVVG